MPQLLMPVVAALVLLVGVRIAPAATTSKWWFSPAIQRQLRLTSGQVDDIDRIFESTLAERRIAREQLDKLERELDAAMERPTVDDAVMTDLIARVEAARARRNGARTLLLYRIRKVLTPDQRRWFDERAKKPEPATSPARPAETSRTRFPAGR